MLERVLKNLLISILMNPKIMAVTVKIPLMKVELTSLLMLSNVVENPSICKRNATKNHEDMNIRMKIK